MSAVHDFAASRLPGHAIEFIDESWDRSIYLVRARAPERAGEFYRIDMASQELENVGAEYPQLLGVPLAPSRTIEIEDPEGVCAAQVAIAPDHDAKLHLRDLSRALQELPPDQREALILVCATGLSYEEAADVCQVAVGTIKSRIARARDRLIELLGDDAAQVTGALPVVARPFDVLPMIRRLYHDGRNASVGSAPRVAACRES